ncbi:transposase [Trichonephila clavipes]|nr:transposase [Trichonephila clavipes]
MGIPETVGEYLVIRVQNCLKCHRNVKISSIKTWSVQPNIILLKSMSRKPRKKRKHYEEYNLVNDAQYFKNVTGDIHKSQHFWLNGYDNKQNCCIWSEPNPQVFVKTPLHPDKLTVWCALWAGGIIGPYFFKHDECHNVTVNGDRYRVMNTNFFIPELNNHDVQELWFQQDGATCHTARATIDLLKDTFGDRLISRFGPMNWPPRSCDLTPLQY